MIYKYNLCEYIDNINIKDEFNKESNAIYIPNKKELTLYLGSIRCSFATLNYYQYRLRSRDIEYKIFYFIFLMENILHELTHVIQYKDYLNNRKDSVGIIIKEQYDFILNSENDKKYQRLYKFLPIERNANCNSLKLILALNYEYNIFESNFIYI